MLILTRRPEESIRIGDAVEVKVLAVEGKQVRIGVTAPGQSVHRNEIYERIQREREEEHGK